MPVKENKIDPSRRPVSPLKSTQDLNRVSNSKMATTRRIIDGNVTKDNPMELEDILVPINSSPGVFTCQPRRPDSRESEHGTAILFSNKEFAKQSMVDLSNLDYLEQYLNMKYPESITPTSSSPKAKSLKKALEDKIARKKTISKLRDFLKQLLNPPKKEDSSPDYEPPDDLLEQTNTMFQEYFEADNMKPMYMNGSNRPYWVDPETRERRWIPATPPFIRKLKRTPKHNAMTRLKLFQESEARKRGKTEAENKKEAARRQKMKDSLSTVSVYPHKYDPELVTVLAKEDSSKTISKQQREAMRAQLKKRDELLVSEIKMLNENRKELLRRSKYFNSASKVYTGYFDPSVESLLLPEPKKGLRNSTLYEEGLRRVLKRQASLLGTYGSITSDSSLRSRRHRPHSCKQFPNIADNTSSGHIAESEHESVFERLTKNKTRCRQVCTYHRLIETRQKLLEVDFMSAHLNKAPKTVQVTEKALEFLKDPTPMETEAESDDERLFTDKDLEFLRKLREKHHINEGDCGLVLPEAEVHPTLEEVIMAEEKVTLWDKKIEPDETKFIRKTPYDPAKQLQIERRRDYNIAMTVFPRKWPSNDNNCMDPFNPLFWEGFCVNKYTIDLVAGPPDPALGKPKYLDFLRYVFNVQPLEDAHPLDKTPEVLYYRLLPSEIGHVGIPDPDPDDKFPKDIPEKTAFDLIPSNSPISSSSAEQFEFGYKQKEVELSTPTGYKTDDENNSRVDQFKSYPIHKFMDKIDAIKKFETIRKKFESKLMNSTRNVELSAKSRKLKSVELAVRKKGVTKIVNPEPKTIPKEMEEVEESYTYLPDKRFVHLTDSLLGCYPEERVKSSRKECPQSGTSGPSSTSEEDNSLHHSTDPEDEDDSGQDENEQQRGKYCSFILDRFLDSPLNSSTSSDKKYKPSPLYRKPKKSCLKKSTKYPTSSDNLKKFH